MAEASLLVICLSAFAAVIILLSLLALAMWLLTFIFPERQGQTDAAVAAAIQVAAQHMLPGARVTHIEELR